MKITIESTSTITTIDGVPVRLWLGRTADGRPVELFIHRVRSDDAEAQRQLDAALAEVAEPIELAAVQQRAIDLRHIL